MRDGVDLIELLKTIEYADIASAGSFSWLLSGYLTAEYSHPPSNRIHHMLGRRDSAGSISPPYPLDYPCPS